MTSRDVTRLVFVSRARVPDPGFAERLQALAIER
jgi:hypothetical protein